MFILENLKNTKNTVKITCNATDLRYLLFMFGYIFLMNAFICDYMLLKPNFHVNV